MNSVATADSRAVGRQAVNPRAVALQVLEGETALLVLRRATNELLATYREARNPPEGLPRAECARRALSLMPTEQQIERLRSDWERALAAGPDDRMNRILLGLMLDSFPAPNSGQPITLIEVILNDLRDQGFPPVTVAEALQSLRRTKTFRPTLAEILEQCAKTREGQRSYLTHLPFVIEQRRGAMRELERSGAKEAGA